MKVASIAARTLAIPFKVAFRHAAAERSITQSLWVEARGQDGSIGYGEGCPREYVTGESIASGRAFVERHAAQWLASLHDVADLERWVAMHAAEIDAEPAAWTAVELALLDLFGRSTRKPVEALLGLPGLSGRFRYTAVLGDAAPDAFAAQLARYRKAGFGTFKIKLAGDPTRDRPKIAALQDAGIAPETVRADANNLWRDAESAIAALRALDFPFFALEEPLSPNDYAGMARIARALGTRIVLDESLLRPGQLDALPAPPERWIANVRVSKAGGLVRALDLVQALRARGIPVIVGAHVGETSILSRAALTVAAAAGDLLIAQEGAFGTHLLARDVVHPPVMFGPGGVLEVARLGLEPAGLGLRIVPPREGDA